MGNSHWRDAALHLSSLEWACHGVDIRLVKIEIVITINIRHLGSRYPHSRVLLPYRLGEYEFLHRPAPSYPAVRWRSLSLSFSQHQNGGKCYLQITFDDVRSQGQERVMQAEFTNFHFRSDSVPKTRTTTIPEIPAPLEKSRLVYHNLVVAKLPTP